MFILKATGEHAGFTGEMGGYKWTNGISEPIQRMADADYLIRLVKFEDVTPDDVFFEWGEIEKVLVVRYGGWGDLIMCTPLIEAIKKFFGNPFVTVACRPTNHDIFWGNKSVDHIMARPATDLPRLYHEFDQVIDVTQSVENCSEAEWMNSYKWICERYGLHEAIDNFEPKYVVLKEEQDWAVKFKKDLKLKRGKKLITLHPEASSPMRSFGTQKALEIAAILADKGHKVVVITSNQIAQTQVKYTCKKCKKNTYLCVSDIVEHVVVKCDDCGAKNTVKWQPFHKNVLFTAGRISFRQCAAIVEQADFHVGVDSAFTHIAGALRTNQLAIYSSFDGQLRTSEMKNITIYQHPFPCAPCCAHLPNLCARMRDLSNNIAPCMADIEPGPIAEMVLDLMKKRRGTKEKPVDWDSRGKVYEIDLFRRECPMCGDWKPQEEMQPVARKAGFTYFCCKSCGSVFTGRAGEAGETEGYQDDGYFKVYETDRLANENKLLVPKIIDETCSELGLPDHKGKRHVLEIGCSVGHLIAGMAERGWNVWGLDCSEYAIKKAKELVGPTVFKGDIEKSHLRRDKIGPIKEMVKRQKNVLPALKSRKGRIIREKKEIEPTILMARNAFDLVVMSHTLEHLLYPVRVLTKAFHLLRPGGLLFMFTPDAETVMRVGVTETPHLVTYDRGEHQCIPSKQGLERAAKEIGFEFALFKYVESASSHYCWLRKPVGWVEEEQKVREE